MEYTRYYMKCTVDEVVDGDTIDVTAHLPFNIRYLVRIRLSNIDAPECRTLRKLEKEAGLKVKQYIKELIEGKNVFLLTSIDNSPSGDKYGRFLADIFLEEGNSEDTLNNLLINKGYVHGGYDGGKREIWTDEELKLIIAT